MHSKESQENKKKSKSRTDVIRSPKQGYQWPCKKDLCPPKISLKSPAKCYPYWEVNPRLLTLLPCMLLSELIPLFAGSLSPLDPYIVMLY